MSARSETSAQLFLGMPAHMRVAHQRENMPSQSPNTTYVIANPEVFFMVEGADPWQWAQWVVPDPDLSDEEVAQYLEERKERLREAFSEGSVSREGFQNILEFDDRIKYDPYSGELAMRFQRRRSVGEPVLDPLDLVYSDPRKHPQDRVHVGYNLYPSVERAMRSGGHIIDRHKPKTGSTRRRMMDTLMITEHEQAQFVEGHVDPDTIDELQQEVASQLSQIGMLDVRLQGLSDIVGQLLTAAHTDSLDRLNSLISRTRTGWAKGEEKRELRRLAGVHRGFTDRKRILTIEREIARAYLEQVMRGVRSVFGMRVSQGRHEFMSVGITQSESQRSVSVLNYLTERFLTLDDITIAPYRPAAARARLAYGGTQSLSSKERAVYLSLVGEDFFGLIQENFPDSFKEVANRYEHNPKGVSVNIRERGLLMTKVLQEALMRGQRNMVPWTDQDYSEKERKKKWEQYHAQQR